MKQAIVVLGFHRSGTSALTGVLDVLGAYTGNDLIPPSEINERGFFENMRVYEANEYILNELCGISWDNIDNPKANVDMAKIESILHFVLKRTFADNPVIAVKDPRICLLIPAYRSVLKDLGYKVSFIRTYRPAEEVCKSIARCFGIDQKRGIGLIMDYSKRVLEEEPESGVISFHDLLNNQDLVLEQLKFHFPFLNYSEENIAKAKAFLSPDLKHF